MSAKLADHVRQTQAKQARKRGGKRKMVSINALSMQQQDDADQAEDPGEGYDQ